MTAQWYDESSTTTVMWDDCPSADIYLNTCRSGVKQVDSTFVRLCISLLLRGSPSGRLSTTKVDG